MLSSHFTAELHLVAHPVGCSICAFPATPAHSGGHYLMRPPLEPSERLRSAASPHYPLEKHFPYRRERQRLLVVTTRILSGGRHSPAFREGDVHDGTDTLTANLSGM